MNLTPRPRRSATAIGAVLVALSATYAACSDSTSPQPSTAFGPSAAMAGGTGRTYVTLDAAGAPTEIGVRLSENVLATLPAGNAMVDYTFELPAQASATPYKQVVIGWNPMGHVPAAYAVPHFDVHFYQVTAAQRAAISPADSQFAAKLALKPAAALIPPSYILTPGGVPNMGAHWVDATGPELNGQPFTSTFIYGSYNGAFIFGEPMIARTYLETHPTLTAPLRIPAQYATSGNYPTTYSVSFDAATKEYRIALGGFVHR